MANFNINVAGYIIVGMFVLTWAGALAIWRYGHVEEKWSREPEARRHDHAAHPRRVPQRFGPSGNSRTAVRPPPGVSS